jgi:hypothetical protein
MQDARRRKNRGGHKSIMSVRSEWQRDCGRTAGVHTHMSLVRNRCMCEGLFAELRCPAWEPDTMY